MSIQNSGPAVKPNRKQEHLLIKLSWLLCLSFWFPFL